MKVHEIPESEGQNKYRSNTEGVAEPEFEVCTKSAKRMATQGKQQNKRNE